MITEAAAAVSKNKILREERIGKNVPRDLFVVAKEFEQLGGVQAGARDVFRSQ